MQTIISVGLFKDFYSLQVLSAARKVNEEDLHKDETSMPGAAGKYAVHNMVVVETIFVILLLLYLLCFMRSLPFW